MEYLIGRRMILEDGSPHSGEIVVITAVTNNKVIAEPVDQNAGFAQVLLPIDDLFDDEILERQEFGY